MEQDSLFVSEGDSKIFINNKFIIVSFKCLFLLCHLNVCFSPMFTHYCPRGSPTLDDDSTWMRSFLASDFMLTARRPH